MAPGGEQRSNSNSQLSTFNHLGRKEGRMQAVFSVQFRSPSVQRNAALTHEQTNTYITYSLTVSDYHISGQSILWRLSVRI